MSVQIIQAKTRKQMKTFRNLPWKIYKNNPIWAPDLIMDLKKRLNKKKHPFYERGSATFYLAYKDGEVSGRIAAIYNPAHNEFHNEKTVFWGFFESIDDQKVADALFNAVINEVKTQDFNKLLGPMSCSTHDEVGTLISGFETQRMLIMPYNPPYYVDLCKNFGMKKAKDLLAFHLDLKKPIPEKVEKIAALVQKRIEKKGFTVRNLNKRNLKKDLRTIMDIYETAWKDNWGFSPMSPREFKEMAINLALVAHKSLVVIVEDKGKPVAMACSIYDIMEATHSVKNWPLCLQGTIQIFNLLWRIFFKRKPKFTRGRLFLAGVMPEYRNTGVDALLYVLPFQAGKKLGITDAELSWELEDNSVINKSITKMGGEIYKKMRIWEIDL